MRHVVVTGMGGVTALGHDWPTIRKSFEARKTAIRYMPEWERFTGINTRLAAPITDFNVEGRYPRKKLRSMGRVSQLATYATESALQNAGLIGSSLIQNGRTGIAYGSSFGSPDSVLGFFELKMNGASKHLSATNYLRMMPQTTVVNLGLFFGVTGRMIPSSSACTSGSLGIGYAYESIRAGKADIMISGGAEELDITDAATFDTLYATSTRNDEATRNPRPFDRDRDGLVVGEGAATLILEELEHAKARGATVIAELVGFGTNSDGNHITQPQAGTMQIALQLALDDASLSKDRIGFVSGHGTATEWGDIAETAATHGIFGAGVPIHSLKGHFGHTLGACGAIEAWLSLEMMRDRWFCATANLTNIDPRCAPLDYIIGSARVIDAEYVMSNNFAFGGINTSLIFKQL